MKTRCIGYIVVVLLVFSCSTPPKKQSDTVVDTQKFGNALIETNYTSFADVPIKDSLNAAVLNSFAVYDDAFYKLVHVDAEELAEFSFDFFLPELNQVLQKRGVQLAVVTPDDYDVSYTISINGHTVQLYTQDDLENGTFWEVAPKNFFSTVNTILKEQDVTERAYLLNGGNDLSVWFLTAEQYSIIKDYYTNEPTAQPYLP